MSRLFGGCLQLSKKQDIMHCIKKTTDYEKIDRIAMWLFPIFFLIGVLQFEIKLLTFWSLLSTDYFTICKLNARIYMRLGRSQSKKAQKYQTLHSDLFPIRLQPSILTDSQIRLLNVTTTLLPNNSNHMSNSSCDQVK